jgi:hypothetical protein
MPAGKLDFRLSRQLAAYKKEDPPPHRVKPIPFALLAHAAEMCGRANTPYANAVADMLLLGFFFLLRPGEYAWTDNDNASPFRLQDVHLLIRDRRIHHSQATEQDYQRINFVALEFTNQKNGVRGELIGLGQSGHPTWCPVHTLIHRVRHLCAHNAPLHTPIYKYYAGHWCNIEM